MERRFTKDEGSFTSLSQTGEPTTIHRFTEWIESETFGGKVVVKAGVTYRLKNGETVVKISDTEFSCPSSRLILRTEEPVIEPD